MYHKHGGRFSFLCLHLVGVNKKWSEKSNRLPIHARLHSILRSNVEKNGQTIRFSTRFSIRFFTRFFTQLPKPKRAKSRTLPLQMAAKKPLILMEVLENKDELDDNPNFTSDPHFYTIKMAVLSPCCKNNSRAKTGNCACTHSTHSTRWPNDSIFFRQHLFHSTFLIAIKLYSASFDAIRLARQGGQTPRFSIRFLVE